MSDNSKSHDLRPIFSPVSRASQIFKYPKLLFFCFIIVHFTLWVILPALTDPNAPPDVIEGYAWGREWPLGTFKHPPMQAWLLELFVNLTGGWKFAHLILAQSAIILAFCAIWRTGCRMMSAKSALIGVLLLEAISYYNVDSAVFNPFNPNLLQMATWALMVDAFHKSLKEKRARDWCLLGIWSAVGLYSKYSTLLLLITFSILMIAIPEGRKQLKNKNPYLALAIILTLFLPQLLWLSLHDFLPFTYVTGRFEHPIQKPYFVVASFDYLSDQFYRLLPALIVFLSAFGIDLVRKKRVNDEQVKLFDKVFLSYVVFIPFISILIFTALTGFEIHTLWSSSFWNFVGLWVVAYTQPTFTPSSIRRFAAIWIIVFLVEAAGYAASADYYPEYLHKPRRVDYPGPNLAERMNDEWRKRYHTPLSYVIGDSWTAGNVSFYSADRPHVLINGDFIENPTISEKDIAQKGGIIVWCVENCHDRLDASLDQKILKNFSNAQQQGTLIFPWQTGFNVPPLHIGWALLPPANKL